MLALIWISFAGGLESLMYPDDENQCPSDNNEGVSGAQLAFLANCIANVGFLFLLIMRLRAAKLTRRL